MSRVASINAACTKVAQLTSRSDHWPYTPSAYKIQTWKPNASFSVILNASGTQTQGDIRNMTIFAQFKAINDGKLPVADCRTGVAMISRLAKACYMKTSSLVGSASAFGPIVSGSIPGDGVAFWCPNFFYL